MTRWNRPRPSSPTAVRLREILERLGTPLSADESESTSDLVNLLERGIDQRVLALETATSVLKVMRGAVNAAPVALVVLDRSGTQLSVSTAAAELLAGGASAVLPHQFLDSVSTRARATGEPCSEVVDVFGPPTRTLTLNAIPVPVDGRVSVGESPVVVLIEDTTEIRRAEMARRDLVTNISHELRTPVGAVALLAETLANEYDPDTIRHLAGRIELEAERLSSTLQDVLSLSRLEASGPADRHELDLSDLVRFSCAKLRPNAQRAGLDLIVARADDGLIVFGDRALLTRALDNLLENAIKYSDKGEPVVVEAFASNGPDGDFATVTVKDTGIGIPRRERQRIFERFYRVDRARGRDTGGSGLGLAIVRHVAVSHDGAVDVDSLEGVGSTFTLRVPLVATSQLQAPRPPDPHEGPGEVTPHVCDDPAVAAATDAPALDTVTVTDNPIHAVPRAAEHTSHPDQKAQSVT